MSDAYVEYLELFEYFGRGGLERLDRCTFDRLNAEFEQLLALKPRWTHEHVERLRELRTVLLRDRPHLRELRVAE